jgi:hypothetical protein
MENLIEQINRRSIPELDLINNDRWRAIKLVYQLQADRIDTEAWQELNATRLRLFREQRDRKILRGILDQSIDDDFLRDPDCWVRISQVRAYHQDEVPTSAWQGLCRKRGLTGGPYRSE